MPHLQMDFWGQWHNVLGFCQFGNSKVSFLKEYNTMKHDKYFPYVLVLCWIDWLTGNAHSLDLNSHIWLVKVMSREVQDSSACLKTA